MNEKARARRLEDNYNLTIEQSDKIEEHQGFVCAICGRKEPIPGRSLAHDHSHIDGLIRGRLCHQCNILVGKLENSYIRQGMHKIEALDFVTIIRGIAGYLEAPPATAALGHKHYGYKRPNTKKHRKLMAKKRRTYPSVSLMETTDEHNT